MLIYALQSFTATDGTVCVAKSTYTVTDAAGQTAIMRGQAQLAEDPAFSGQLYAVNSGGSNAGVQWNATRTGFVDPVTGGVLPVLIGTTQLAMSGTQAVANDTATPLQFDSAVLDTFSTWAIGSPSNIVVPVRATRMRVFYHCEWSIDATKTGYRSLRMLVNGAQAANPYVSSTTVGVPNGAISDHSNCVSLIMGCTAGDILTFSARHTMGSSINLIPASQRAIVEWYGA